MRVRESLSFSQSVSATLSSLSSPAASGASQNEYATLYLPYTALFVLGVYLAVWLVSVFLLDKKRERSRGYEARYDARLSADATTLELLCVYVSGMFCCCCGGGGLCATQPLLFARTTYESLLCGRCGSAFLLLWRGAAWLALTLCNVYLRFAAQPGALRRFNGWNNVLVSVYFTLAALLSAAHVRPCARREELERERESSAPVERVAAFALALRAVVATNALFVLGVRYLHYDPQLDRAALLRYVAPAACLAVDALFDGALYRAEHYPHALSLPVAYLLYAWAREAQGAQASPYAFLQTRTATCFASYALLFAAHVAAHAALWALCACRDKLAGVTYADRHRVGDAYHGEEEQRSERDAEDDQAPSAPPPPSASTYVRAHLEQHDEDFDRFQDEESARPAEPVARAVAATRTTRMARL